MVTSVVCQLMEILLRHFIPQLFNLGLGCVIRLPTIHPQPPSFIELRVLGIQRIAQ